MIAANELTTVDGRHEEQRRRAAEFQALIDAEAAEAADVIDLRDSEAFR